MKLTQANKDTLRRQLQRMGKHEILYADPAWQYSFSNSTGRSIEEHYPTMTIKEICALTPPAEDDAVLFMWVTAPKLPLAFRVAVAWGFKEYVTGYVWDKRPVQRVLQAVLLRLPVSLMKAIGVWLTGQTPGKLGRGYWSRVDHEHLLIFRRGKFSPPAIKFRQSSVWTCALRGHSVKPDEVRDWINKTWPQHSKIELFATSKHKGWSAWGDKV